MCAGVLLVSAWTPLSSSFRSKMAELFKFFWFFGSLGGWKSIHQNFKCQLLKASRCSRTFDKIYVIDNCVLFHISCGLKCYLISASSMQGFLLFALIEWMDFHLGWMDFRLGRMDFHPGWMNFQTSGRSSIKMDGWARLPFQMFIFPKKIYM